MTSTPTRCSFTYRGKAAAVLLSQGKVTIHFDGQALVGSYRNGQIILEKPNPIAVEAAAALRNQRGEDVSALSVEATPEARVRKQVRETIGALDDVFLLANPVGQAEFFDEKTNKIRVVDYGLGPGSPDFIIALRRGVGCQLLGLECKAPGKAPRQNQKDCHALWSRAGIWMYTVQSGQEADLAIADARRRLEC